MVLLLALIPTFTSHAFLREGIESCDTLESVSMSTISEDTIGSNLTWTSRTEGVPQPLGNNSQAVGDHVIINGTQQ